MEGQTEEGEEGEREKEGALKECKKNTQDESRLKMRWAGEAECRCRGYQNGMKSMTGGDGNGERMVRCGTMVSSLC